ncbi:BrnA antitoxin family protein [Polycyclovorans algicola]|uniref:BrnA antitoxin family protein n=1 Tax=Polycyclovorans algicola TaxID=616992 RepID=UPI0004A72A88|nr:BrnA antitoxin family protein [Polycyclovorans algicola]
MNVNKHATGKSWVDPDDAPELTDDFFQRADEYNGEALVKRGRPKATETKERITIRLSPDVLKSFRATGSGWQTRVDGALREWLKQHSAD